MIEQPRQISALEAACRNLRSGRAGFARRFVSLVTAIAFLAGNIGWTQISPAVAETAATSSGASNNGELQRPSLKKTAGCCCGHRGAGCSCGCCSGKPVVLHAVSPCCAKRAKTVAKKSEAESKSEDQAANHFVACSCGGAPLHVFTTVSSPKLCSKPLSLVGLDESRVLVTIGLLPASGDNTPPELPPPRELAA